VGLELFNVAGDMVKGWVLINTVMNFLVLLSKLKFLTGGGNFTFSRKTPSGAAG
jgi:hypothetical protein